MGRDERGSDRDGGGGSVPALGHQKAGLLQVGMPGSPSIRAALGHWHGLSLRHLPPMGSGLAFSTSHQHIPTGNHLSTETRQPGVQSIPSHATACSAAAVSLSPLQTPLSSFYPTPHPGAVMPPRQWSGHFGGTLQQEEICPSFWCDSSVVTPVLTHPCYQQAKLAEVKNGSHSSHGGYGSHCLMVLR